MISIALSLDDPAELPLLTEHQPVEFACAAPENARLALAIGGQPLEPFMRPGDLCWRWRWNPGSAVGLHQATLEATWPDGGVTRQEWSLRVAPRKLDQERYELLLADLQRVAYELVFTLAGVAAEGASRSREPAETGSPAEAYYTLFEQRLDQFERAVRRIAARPREQLRREREQAPLGQAPALDTSALAEIARGPFDTAPEGIAPDLQAAIQPRGGLLPRGVSVERSDPTTDTYEHRLLKQLLTLLLRRARAIGALAEREALIGGARQKRAREIAAGCVEAARRLRELRESPFLAGVGALPAFQGPTPLFQRDAAYRDVYRMWQALRRHSETFVAFDSPLFSIPIADLPRLYESWCALQVAHALLVSGGTIREQRLVETRQPASDEDELERRVMLIEQRPLLTIQHGKQILILRYQPRYRPQAGKQPATPNGNIASGKFESLDHQTHVPDLAIEARRRGAPPQVLILDAKYRLGEDGQGLPPDALADAYTYLGAIGCAGARATIGAILLYPGTGPATIYTSGVGILSLLPGQAESGVVLPQLLAELVLAMPEKL